MCQCLYSNSVGRKMLSSTGRDVGSYKTEKKNERMERKIWMTTCGRSEMKGRLDKKHNCHFEPTDIFACFVQILQLITIGRRQSSEVSILSFLISISEHLIVNFFTLLLWENMKEDAQGVTTIWKIRRKYSCGICQFKLGLNTMDINTRQDFISIRLPCVYQPTVTLLDGKLLWHVKC